MEKVRKCMYESMETGMSSMFGIQGKEALNDKCYH